jgi:hypothetical protein
VNGDSIDDVLITDVGAGSMRRGYAYVCFMTAQGVAGDCVKHFLPATPGNHDDGFGNGAAALGE